MLDSGGISESCDYYFDNDNDYVSSQGPSSSVNRPPRGKAKSGKLLPKDLGGSGV